MEQIFKNKLSEEQTSFLKDAIKNSTKIEHTKDAIKNSTKIEHTKEIKPTFKCRLCGHDVYTGFLGRLEKIHHNDLLCFTHHVCSKCVYEKLFSDEEPCLSCWGNHSWNKICKWEPKL